jgi:hypothetical protein
MKMMFFWGFYLQVIHKTVHFTCSQNSEHRLTNVKSVPPVVIAYRPVILLDT